MNSNVSGIMNDSVPAFLTALADRVESNQVHPGLGEPIEDGGQVTSTEAEWAMSMSIWLEVKVVHTRRLAPADGLDGEAQPGSGPGRS